MEHARRGERGQTVPLVVMLLALVVVVLFGVARLSRGVAGHAAAQSAADAAALAGALDGRAGAARLARANGAELVSFHADGDVVEVEVRRGRVHAVARAEVVAELASG